MLVISDLHWRTDTPAWRKEKDYAAEVLRPMLGRLLGSGQAVCVAGDLFHRSANFADTYDLFTFLRENDWMLYATPGQHDMTYHNFDMKRTGFNLLVEAGLVIPLGPRARDLSGLNVYGMGWGETMPTLPKESDYANRANVLVAHVSVSHNGAEIPGATSATSFLHNARANGFDVVFTGDNHKRFAVIESDHGLYNAGCFHRMTVDLKEQPPAGWVITPNLAVGLYPITAPEPLIDTAYCMAGGKKGDAAAIAGVEFVKALAEARQHGGGDIFMDTIKKAATTMKGSAKLLIDELIITCKEKHQ